MEAAENGTKNLSTKEIRRYSHQINQKGIGLEGQEKIKGSKVLIIGAGGKGTAVLQVLSSIGVGYMGICDDFLVEESTLSRQHLYGNIDIGKQKAIVSKQKLQEINHFISYELHNVCLNENNIDKIVGGYDILVDATDNFPTRYLISDAAIRMEKPLVFGSVHNHTAMVSVFNYQRGPSLRCAYPKPPSGTVDNVDGFACHTSLLSMVGSIIANEVLKIILDKSTVLSGNIMKISGVTYDASFQLVEKNEENFALSKL